MKKKVIIIGVGVGLLGFAATFSVAWLTRPQAPSEADPAAVAAADNADAALRRMLPPADQDAVMAVTASKSLTEKQLKTLMYDVREKIDDYNTRLQELNLREERMQVAQQQLRHDIEEMNDLRVELAAAVAALKQQQQTLESSKVEIAKIEQDNLRLMAATYDKMDAESAGKIITNMIQVQSKTGFDDAVKILYYMTERTKAKVLAAIAEKEPSISAVVCQRLKYTVERN